MAAIADSPDTPVILRRAPALLLDRTPACADDPDLWFSPDREHPRAQRDREAAAEVICGGCPLRARCLAGALERGERWGIWGGVNFEVRRMCGNGLHRMTVANTWVDTRGYRNCRACRKTQQQRKAAAS